ncbi:MAG: VTT domain-containing protein [Solirubrobacterales bacterium]
MSSERPPPPGWTVWLLETVQRLWPEGKRARTIVTVLLVTALVALIAFAFLLPFAVDDSTPGAVILGFVAIFIVNAISTFTIPTPGLSILGQALIAYYGAQVDPILAGVVGGTAMAVGQIPNYAVGSVAWGAVETRISDRPKLQERVNAVADRVERRGWLAVSTLSFVPNPFTLFGDMAAGYSRMPFGVFFLAAWGARLARSLIIAFLGAAFLDGLEW